MKKLLLGLGLALLSCQTVAITTIAGIEFIDVADTLTVSVGSFTNNTTGTGPAPIADGNGASWVMSNNNPFPGISTLDVSFGSSTALRSANVDDVNLTLLFVGNSYPHEGSITLTGGTSRFSTPFSLDTGLDNLNGYTGFNSVTASESPGGTPDTFGIYALTIPLTGGGTFNGVHLDISSGVSAVPSLLGTTVVPVPAAVWLFGSGLIALAGAARRRT